MAFALCKGSYDWKCCFSLRSHNFIIYDCGRIIFVIFEDMFDKNEHENILTNNLQHEPVLKTVVYTFYCLKSIYMYIHQNETLCF